MKTLNIALAALLLPAALVLAPDRPVLPRPRRAGVGPDAPLCIRAVRARYARGGAAGRCNAGGDPRGRRRGHGGARASQRDDDRAVQALDANSPGDTRARRAP